MNSPVKLYTYFRSSCAYRVRIALNIKSIPYEAIPVHLLRNGGEQHAPGYTQLNPSHQVPCLIDGLHTIGQSMAILEYLDEEFPRPQLLPNTRPERATIRQMCEVINSGIQPLQNLSVLQYLTGTLKLSEEQKLEWARHWIRRGFDSFESLLKIHSGKYSFGETVTLADCLLVPQVFAARRFQFDFSPYPRTIEIYDRCMQLTDFIRASPEKQPDYEA